MRRFGRILTQSTRNLKTTGLDSYVYAVKKFTKINSKWITDRKERVESFN